MKLMATTLVLLVLMQSAFAITNPVAPAELAHISEQQATYSDYIAVINKILNQFDLNKMVKKQHELYAPDQITLKKYGKLPTFIHVIDHNVISMHVYILVLPIVWDVIAGTGYNQGCRRLFRGVDSGVEGLANMVLKFMNQQIEQDNEHTLAEIAGLKANLQSLVQLFAELAQAQDKPSPTLNVLVSKVRALKARKEISLSEVRDELNYFNKHYTDFKNVLSFQSLDEIAALISSGKISKSLSFKDKIRNQIERMKVYVSRLKQSMDEQKITADKNLDAIEKASQDAIIRMQTENYNRLMASLTQLQLIEGELELADNDAGMLRALVASNQGLQKLSPQDQRNADKVMEALRLQIAQGQTLRETMAQPIK